MKLIELLQDKLMGMYIDLIQENEVIKSVYHGMNAEKKFIVETDKPLPIGESVTLRLSISGWNLNMPCIVEKIEGTKFILKPLGKVKIREKRKEKRVPTVMKCTVNSESDTLIDVSYHGMRVLTLNDYDLDSTVSVGIKGNTLTGVIKWKRAEEVDLKSIGIMIDDPPEWWVDLVKAEIKKYITALRRL